MRGRRSFQFQRASSPSTRRSHQARGRRTPRRARRNRHRARNRPGVSGGPRAGPSLQPAATMRVGPSTTEPAALASVENDRLQPAFAKQAVRSFPRWGARLATGLTFAAVVLSARSVERDAGVVRLPDTPRKAPIRIDSPPLVAAGSGRAKPPAVHRVHELARASADLPRAAPSETRRRPVPQPFPMPKLPAPDPSGEPIVTRQPTPIVADRHFEFSPPATVSVTPKSDDRLVRDTLQRYRLAYEGLNARSAREVWPAVDEPALERAFEGLASQTLTFNECAVQLHGAVATARCRGSATYTPRIGNRETHVEPRVWNFTLRKVDAGWQIDAARVAR
jgi:hypothetical protein